MKKVCALLLAFIFVLSLVACGSNETKDDTSAKATEEVVEATEDPYSKDSLMAIANDPNTQVVDVKDVLAEIDNNEAKAKLTYSDKVFVVKGMVTMIWDDSIILEPYPGEMNHRLNVILPIEEIAELKEYDKITVVGHFDAETPQIMDIAYIIDYNTD